MFGCSSNAQRSCTKIATLVFFPVFFSLQTSPEWLAAVHCLGLVLEGLSQLLAPWLFLEAVNQLILLLLLSQIMSLPDL